MTVAAPIKDHPVLAIIQEEYIHRKLGAWFGPEKIREILQKQDIGYQARGAALRLAAKYGQVQTVFVLIQDCTQERKIISLDVLEAWKIAHDKKHAKITAFLSDCIQAKYPWLTAP